MTKFIIWNCFQLLQENELVNGVFLNFELIILNWSEAIDYSIFKD
ncbi:hypothetical protein LYNGBM3L_60800 [Moorena producens 3L]|uniref:Uncharacterized protein n=1 Tax=Moorena producens 3L TaxID=489825 RepID=F4Y0F3_9CYAN|nr:hypothetical protein LYNGBM3L_60800 [Moorena producens 3L]